MHQIRRPNHAPAEASSLINLQVHQVQPMLLCQEASLCQLQPLASKLLKPSSRSGVPVTSSPYQMQHCSDLKTQQDQIHNNCCISMRDLLPPHHARLHFMAGATARSQFQNAQELPQELIAVCIRDLQPSSRYEIQHLLSITWFNTTRFMSRDDPAEPLPPSCSHTMCRNCRLAARAFPACSPTLISQRTYMSVHALAHAHCTFQPGSQISAAALAVDK